ncbi:hypothetical protein HDU89_000655 [Geranomyces variabilis]|nr:hypothetical protein HDU89_000655 [Geranomyces variabilis]
MADPAATIQPPPAEATFLDQPQRRAEETPGTTDDAAHTDATSGDADRAYEEAIELEYAKREGGA